jgi:toxin ParE1/3/4
MKRPVYRPSVFERDLAQIADYLADHASVDTGLRFLEAAEETIDWLATTEIVPGPVQAASPKLAGLHAWPVNGFENYLIFLRVRGDELALVRLLHGARDLDTILGS